ncbi:ATP-binding protein [Opitutus terrae]|uniref:histidine kinase n=1 Tax=Opitutus terrae (strain DSM 11246 / JCM 15787 / PB90-1) TaxID=452637 RepID=B1ZVP0_OPITP|nr:ATP-binding protein [Opitutus terrae]ACB74137.1 PAS/PAC sensor hybrid histidine kinase [Opitutus terrae PB90-1]
MKTARRKRAPAAKPVPQALLAAALAAQTDGVVLSRICAPPVRLKILFANDAFCTMTGRTRAELGEHPQWMLHVDGSDFDQVERWFRRAKAGRGCAGEGYLLHKDGSTFYAAWQFSAVFDRRGRPSHLIATYRDTTEKRRLQESLVQTQRLEAVGRLAGGVAHDFNNLLSVINGYCEMLAAQVSDRPQALREVSEIHRAGLRAAGLTRQLLAFGRRQPMDPRVINLNRLVQEHAQIMSRLIGNAGQLELELAENIGRVRADPSQFQQVLLNLVINARDALRDRGRITISTSNREIKPGLNRRSSDTPPGRYVCLTVTDNGTGIDAETQKHLFEPFFTTKPEGKGTGLGLALVYGVVQQSGGTIQVRSALLAGSTFEILLPEVREAEDDTAPAKATPLPATRGHETLLLVEEDELVRKMIAGMLNADGYRVLAVRDTAEALTASRAAERPVQLLIASPDADGQALAHELHARSSALRMLCVGTFDTLRPVGWLEAKRQATIEKPFALSEVLRHVRALLDA